MGNGELSRRCMAGKFAIAPLPTIGASTGEFAHPTDPSFPLGCIRAVRTTSLLRGQLLGLLRHLQTGEQLHVALEAFQAGQLGALVLDRGRELPPLVGELGPRAFLVRHAALPDGLVFLQRGTVGAKIELRQIGRGALRRGGWLSAGGLGRDLRAGGNERVTPGLMPVTGSGALGGENRGLALCSAIRGQDEFVLVACDNAIGSGAVCANDAERRARAGGRPRRARWSGWPRRSGIALGPCFAPRTRRPGIALEAGFTLRTRRAFPAASHGERH